MDYLTSPVSQKVESWTHYNEWGEITHNAVLKMGQRELDLVKNYTGHDFDAVLNMYYAKARMYDAENRRFVSIDPILDGTKYDLKDYATEAINFTAYVYVRDNPLRWIDPLGLIVDDDSVGLGGNPDPVKYLHPATDITKGLWTDFFINDKKKTVSHNVIFEPGGEVYFPLEEMAALFDFDYEKGEGKTNLNGSVTIKPVTLTSNDDNYKKVNFSAPVWNEGKAITIADGISADITTADNWALSNVIDVRYYNNNPYITLSSFEILLNSLRDKDYYCKFLCSPDQYGEKRYVFVEPMTTSGTYEGKRVSYFKDGQYFVYGDYQFVEAVSYTNMTYDDWHLVKSYIGGQATEAGISYALEEIIPMISDNGMFLTKSLFTSYDIVSTVDMLLAELVTPTAFATGLYTRTFKVRKLQDTASAGTTSVPLPYRYYDLTIYYKSPSMLNTEIEHISITANPTYERWTTYY